MKIKLTWKIWLWLIVLLFALISIFVSSNGITFLQKGVLINSVESNSTAFNEGLRQEQIITAIDGQKIESVEDYTNIIQEKFSGEKIKLTITTTDLEVVLYSNESPQITVSEIPKTNIQTGLDLSGGSRALIQTENHTLTKEEANLLVDTISNRFNTYGISDMTIRIVQDLQGNYFVSIEIAGATPKDMESLISQQGKFEGKIGNETIFTGGNQDIPSVCQNAECSRFYECQPSSEGYYCPFEFTVYLSEEASERQANITKTLSIITSSQGEKVLSSNLDLYIDEILMDSLEISSGLQGLVTTQVSISGSGTGTTEEDAYNDAVSEMKNLKTILQTGSLPFKLQIVKLDTISPTLGQSFIKYIFIAGFAALLAVAIIIFIRYHGLKSSLAPLIICTSEIIITLGVAAFIQWDLDLASIAGILAAIGTGVDDQIVVLDEAKNKEGSLGMKEKIKRAFTIILGAYFTSVASLLPMWWAGAGLLKGFVMTTLIGITLGVLITRPAFADIIKITEKD
ncbi:PDZ domain-containing protein [Candidatus Pacearchaeota archaeon]|jgi:preprotein translocase subunit SecD|nr:PDZ domain-containing protein [Candidatus Pacearchaeota archaeon]